MNLHALRIFHMVALHGSVTRAAEALLISQPAVTMQLKQLEQELGVTLLLPKGRGIALSEAGQLLAREAARLFQLEEAAARKLEEYKSGRTGSLTIAATYLPATRLLPGVLAAFKSRNTGIRVTLLTGHAEEAVRLVSERRADLAIVGGRRLADESLDRELLLHDELWFVVPGGHPLAGQPAGLFDLMQEPFVLQEPGSSTREQLLALCRAHQVPMIRTGIECSGMSEAIQIVAAGYGAALVSALEVQELVTRGTLARVFVREDAGRNPIALYRRRDEEPSPAAGPFVRLLREAAIAADIGS
ncbi:LysR family transcriptional regulator [Paenibacillus sp. J31TS4]|uniref:LysR family transcriptional regulator n=1 Tax=Paenibacillus sp. J31TS4 TaxID=2807195 RepID=UPI001B05BAD5|nr:LysR family transcriptional regulator [Paenibacillus sp. J31TS4]GIP37663.1 LysR family transcriptional regulator [Paenibacillus sp. J31TS4]